MREVKVVVALVVRVEVESVEGSEGECSEITDKWQKQVEMGQYGVRWVVSEKDLLE